MHTNKNAAFLLNVVLSMLILAYITFITVYEQILTQNNGFFNVIVYGVVLILVFIFITLFIRILSFKNNAEKSPILSVLKVVGIIGLFALFVFIRLRYTSSISPNESALYNTAKYIVNGQLDQAKDIHSHIISYPADFVYGYILSDIFSITGSETSVYIIVNIAMMLITALFVFLTVNLIAGQACATLAVIITLFMPNNGYLVYSYNSELFVSAVYAVSLFLYELLIYRRFKNASTGRIIALICGVFGGISLGCEPVLILTYIALTIWVIRANRQTRFSSVLPLILALVEALLILLLKSLMMAVSFSETLKGYFLCFIPSHVRDANGAEFSIGNLFSTLTNRLNNPSRFLDDNSYFLSKADGGVISSDQALWLSVLDQFIYLFVLILCVLCVVYIIRVTYDKIIPLYSVLIALFLGQVLAGCNEVSYIYLSVTVIIIGSSTAYYMYFNHHPGDAVEYTNEEIRQENMLISESEAENTEEEAEESSEYMIRARALVFIGEDDALYQQIKQEEKINRANSSIAATVIKTGIDESGEYNSVSQDVEYFDEPDQQVEKKTIHEVVAIPATRPVEVVKPLLAEDYVSENNELYSNESDLPVIASVDNSPEVDSSDVEDYLDEPDSVENIQKPEPLVKEPVQPEGFVFRKKEAGTNSTAKSPVNKSARPVKQEKPVKEEKTVDKKADKMAIKEAEKDAKKAAKDAKRAAKKGMALNQEINTDNKPLKDVKPGEPLPNPLKGPAPSNKKNVGFDFDFDDGDDFDF